LIIRFHPLVFETLLQPGDVAAIDKNLALREVGMTDFADFR
jgi:hypothetical protein